MKKEGPLKREEERESSVIHMTNKQRGDALGGKKGDQ